MKEKLFSRLFILQKTINNIGVYSEKNCLILFQSAITTEALLEVLIKLDYNNFYPVYHDYHNQTEAYCRLCCEYTEVDNNRIAFTSGLTKINDHLKKCLFILGFQDIKLQEQCAS